MIARSPPVAPSLRTSRSVRLGAVVTAVLAALALAGLLIGVPPSVACCAEGPSVWHPLGLDLSGRDLALLSLRGLATTTLIVLASSALALGFGTVYGAFTAGLPTRLGALGMRVVDVVSATPITLIVVTLMVAVRGARDTLPTALAPVLDSRFLLVFCVASLQWFAVARVVHARLTSLAERPFVRSARIIGMGRVQLWLVHVIPHARRPLFVFALLSLPGGVLAEGFFSFIGFGVEAPQVSLGQLVGSGARALSVAPLTFFVPALLLVAATMGLQIWGARLREDLFADESPTSGRSR